MISSHLTVHLLTRSNGKKSISHQKQLCKLPMVWLNIFYATIIAPDDKGYFADENGFHRVTSDMHELTQKIKQDYPNVPIILFGHSMGSFLSRRYIQLYGNEIDGVILCGTGGDQGVIGKIGEIIAKFEKHRIGRRTPSKLMDKLIFGNYNKHYNNPQTSFDFL